MPELRRALPPAAAPFTLEPTKRDMAAYVRRRRRGVAGLGHDSAGTLPVEIRNALPAFRPYVYRGTGADQLLGTYGDEHLDRPRDW